MEESSSTEGGSQPPKVPGRGKLLALIVVAVVVVAALGITLAVLLSPSSPPSSGVRLTSVAVTSQGNTTAVDQGDVFTVTAAAKDSNNADQTAKAAFTWRSSPAGAVTFNATSGTPTVKITGVQGGSVTVTANATWNGGSKEGTFTLTVRALQFVLVAAPSDPLLGTSFGITLTVKRTADASVASAYHGMVNFTSDDPSGKYPANYALSLADRGVHFFSGFVLQKPGPVQITARDTVFPISGSVPVLSNQHPVASFILAHDAQDPRRITVDGSGSSDPDGDPITYAWDFGDSGSATGATAAHTYAAAGTYLIQLVVTDNHTAHGMAQQSYQAHAPPVAAFSTESEALVLGAIFYVANATASTGGDGSITYYNWTWGDGNYSQGTYRYGFHNYTTYFDGQTLTVTLRVGSSWGLTNRTSVHVLITSRPPPPTATYTYTLTVGPVVNRHAVRTLAVDASGSTSPTGIALLYYNITWGDAPSNYTNTSSPSASHQYWADGTYWVNLTVADAAGGIGYHNVSVSVVVAPAPPVASFTIDRERMRVYVDANASWDPNNDLLYYNWSWGAGGSYTNTTLPYAAFSYSTPGKYTVTLVVIDVGGKKGTAASTVSVAASTIDYTFYDFFNVPYGEWWDHRGGQYGDLPIGADCFNATSIADGACTPTDPNVPDYETYPYTDWFPAPGDTIWSGTKNDPFVYAPYRFHAVGSGIPIYNISQPVFLPVMNYNQAPGQRLDFRWYMQYLDNVTATALSNEGCPINPFANDGFFLRSTINLTMDAQESRRMFNVPSTATTAIALQNWWTAATKPVCYLSGSAESNLQAWFVAEGGPNGGHGKYEIYNAYQYYYSPFFTKINATVDADGTTHLNIVHSAWGTEALMARWLYWGNTSYYANALNSSRARGLWGMELPWFEDFHFSGSLTSSGLDFNLTTAMEYHFEQVTLPGPDGYLNQKGDIPAWTWGPWLGDYYNGSLNTHPVTELSRYPNSKYLHSTPGANSYNKTLAYDYIPSTWNLQAGQTWHFEFPTGNVVFYDPNKTPIPANPTTGAFVKVNVPVAYSSTYPASYGSWDATARTWDVIGPASTGGPAGTPGPDGIPGTADDQYALTPWGAITLVPASGFLTTPSLAATPFAVVTTAGSSATQPGSARSVVPMDSAVAMLLGRAQAWAAPEVATIPSIYVRD